MTVLLTLFYWFQWRPSQIKRNCVEENEVLAEKIAQIKGNITNANFESLYNQCLHKNGL